MFGDLASLVGVLQVLINKEKLKKKKQVHPSLNMLSTFRNRNNKHLPTGEESRHVTVNRKDQLLK